MIRWTTAHSQYLEIYRLVLLLSTSFIKCEPLQYPATHKSDRGIFIFDGHASVHRAGKIDKYLVFQQFDTRAQLPGQISVVIDKREYLGGTIGSINRVAERNDQAMRST